MPPDLDAIEKRILRRYELGRLRSALWYALAVIVLGGVYCLTQQRGAVFWGLAGVTAGASAALFWRGLDVGRGVLPGLVGGAAGLAVMHCGLTCGDDCAGPCGVACMRICAGAGLLAGIAMAVVLGERPRSWLTWIAAGALALLLGLLGCPELVASHVLAFGGTLALGTTVGLLAGRATHGA